VDHEYQNLIPPNNKVPVIISKDTGRADDPYEEYLSQGRAFSQEKGWKGLETQHDENAGATLCYTSGTTGRVSGVGCMHGVLQPLIEFHDSPRGSSRL
jgi:long-subunit acyl-CoA synthetase (AMP-forming)